VGQDAPSYRFVDDSLRAAPIVPGGSPYLPDGRTIAGDTGAPIPCRCVFRGQDFKVGQSVCMNTHVGTVITRCELHLNNTSWTPTDTPCLTSEAPSVLTTSLRRLAGLSVRPSR
jgi:hypothetical protein